MARHAALQIEARDAELERAAEMLGVARRRGAAQAAALAQLKEDATAIVRTHALHGGTAAVEAMASAVALADALTEAPPPPWSPREEGIASGEGRPGSSTDAQPAPPQ